MSTAIKNIKNMLRFTNTQKLSKKYIKKVIQNDKLFFQININISRQNNIKCFCFILSNNP